jgi:hypothetical protein
MPLTTIHFETLRERSNRALERAGVGPGAPAEAPQKITAQQRRRIARLLDRRADIEDLATTQNQREAYGIERWHQDFVMLRELCTFPGTDLTGEALRRKVWSAVPNSRFKRFQQLFSRPYHWIVPPFDMGAKNTVTFRGSPDFNALSLGGCLVSPDLVPDELARDLRLCEFTEEDHRHPERRLVKKHAAVPRLKKLWESATSLQPDHHRILVVSPSTPEIDRAYGEDTPGPDPASLGSILYAREENQKAEEPHRLQVQLFGSAYCAYRKTLHERENYDEEIPELAVMEEKIEALRTRLDTEWGDPANRPALRTLCTQVAAECVEALKHCENTHKVQAHDLIAEAGTLEDKSGKQNPSRSMSKYTAAINRFRSRYAEAKGKGGFNEQDRMTLRQHISRQEYILQGFRTSVVSGAPAFAQQHAQLFADTTMPIPTVEKQAQGLLARSGIDPRPLQRVTLQPLRFYGEHLQEAHRDLDAALRTQDQHMAMDTVLRMHLIGKFQTVRSWFEKLKADMVDADHISIRRIRTFVAALQKLFSTFQIYPNRIVEEYRQPFEQLERGLEGIQQLLAPFEHQDLDIGQRTALFRALKNYLDEFDVEGMAERFS